jgi:hypothetical protein
LPWQFPQFVGAAEAGNAKAAASSTAARLIGFNITTLQEKAPDVLGKGRPKAVAITLPHPAEVIRGKVLISHDPLYGIGQTREG